MMRPRPKKQGKKSFEKAYMDYWKRQGYPPSLGQIAKQTGMSEQKAADVYRELVKLDKIPAKIGAVKKREELRLSANEYAALMFAQEYKKQTGRQADPKLLNEVLGGKVNFERVVKNLRKKLGPKEFSELFTVKTPVRRAADELKKYQDYLEKLRREEQ